jgi:CTP synthase (UTP-ammonia lyase)
VRRAGSGSFEFVPGPTDDLEQVRIAVVGDRIADYAPHDSIEAALTHSAAGTGTAVTVDWHDTTTLEGDAPEQLRSGDAIWCAPGSPFRSMEGALSGIRYARESGRPFVGTCSGFQHGVIEFARNVLRRHDAHHAEYGPDKSSSTLFIDELLCSLVGETMEVRLVDDRTRALYGTDVALEQYYCRFGLNEEHVPALRDAGLAVAGVDDADGTTRIMRVAEHAFFYLTLFVPQVASTPERPHPLVTAYLEAALRTRAEARTA